MTQPGGSNTGACKPRPCIICGLPTLGRGAQYGDPDCREAGETWIACALRRNAQRARPKPVSKIVAEAMGAGHPIPPELGLYQRRAEREAAGVA